MQPFFLALRVIILFWSLTFHSIDVGAAEKIPWPTISPLHAVFTVSTEEPHIETTIFSKEGKPLYHFTCHPGDYVDEYGSDYDHMYQCKMIPVDSNDILFDLFKPSEKWNKTRTRALFNYEHVAGGCKNHPYYGSKRQFSMRYMDVTLEIVKFSSPSMADMLKGKQKPYFSFQMVVDIRPNPEAVLSHVSPVPEICEGSYELNNKGVAQEKIIIDKDPALNFKK